MGAPPLSQLYGDKGGNLDPNQPMSFRPKHSEVEKPAVVLLSHPHKETGRSFEERPLLIQSELRFMRETENLPGSHRRPVYRA